MCHCLIRTIPQPLAVLMLLLFAALLPVVAGGPLFWRIDNFADLDKGELRGVTIAGNGAVTLGPAVSEIVDLKQAHVWSSVADSAGNLYLGVGNEGRIFRVDPSGKSGLFHQTPEVSVMALAVDARGIIYAGTAPDGRVYRITPQGEARVFFEPKSKYIWGLAFDPQGRLLVATGEKGTLYRVAPDGAATTLATVSQANLTSLRVDPAGNILVGTDPGGMVLRISPEGRVFTLFDSEQREIRDLVLGENGSIYALALAESAGSGAANSTPAPAPAGGSLIASSGAGGGEGSVTVTLSDVQVIDGGGAAATTGGGASGQAKSILYRLDADGAWQNLWESRDAVGLALTRREDGRLLVGTSLRGRIYEVDPARQAAPTGVTSLLTSLPEGQVARFITVGKRLYAATSNLGKIYEIASGSGAATGTVTGQVCDSVHHASWGRITHTGSGRIELQTRSGNTATPDATWSDWVDAAERVASPPARFLQWRATLRRTAEAPNPTLREVLIAYLPRNLAPRLTSLTVLPVGVALQPVPPPPMEGVPAALLGDATALASNMAMPPRRVFQQGALSLQWQAEDRNGDPLEYTVLYRLDTGGETYTLRTGLRENHLTIDAQDLPDGRYVFRVIASDHPANPARSALTGERETEAVSIDNTAPELEVATPRYEGAQATLTLVARDAGTILRRAEYQLDGGPWRPVFPVDGLADSNREEFSVLVDLPDRRPRLVAWRVFDANANIGTARTTVVLP